MIECYPDGDEKHNLPKELVRSRVAYGPEIKAEVACLYTDGLLSINRIASFLSMQTRGGVNISQGTVSNILREMAEKSEGCVPEITKKLLSQRVLPTDATVMSVNGRDGLRAVFLRPRRGPLHRHGAQEQGGV